jgi:predicted transposase/invertase (TIGR01784 family)
MSSPEIPQPHDSLVRYTFGQVQHAASFFRENLSATLASAIRWDELKLLGGSFVDEQLRQAETDLLYQVPLRDTTEGAGEERSLFLYLLFEHQSTTDRWMPLRLLRYMGEIWQRHIGEQPAAAGLPPIIPMVLAQVAGGWKVSPRFHDQVLWPKEPLLRKSLELHQPQFEHALIDLAGIDLQALRGSLVARLTQGLLKIRIEGDDGVVVDWAFPLLAEADRAKIGPDSMLPLYRYLLSVTGLNKEEFRARLARSAISRDTTQSIMTLADQLISEGLLKGREEGREEGALIGRVQTLQQLLGRAPDPLFTLAGMPKEQLELTAARLERELGERLK